MKPLLLKIGAPTERMLDRLSEHFEIEPMPRDLDAFADDEGKRVEAMLMVGHAAIDDALMARFPSLKIVSNYGVGYDTIDAEAAAARGVVVTHTPGVLNEEVASTAILLALACHRQLVRDDAYVRSGEWERSGAAALSRTMHGRTVGILGMGRIGGAIARKFEAFGCPILYTSRSEKDVPYEYVPDLAEMAERSKILVVITPGGDETRGLVDAKVLEALGPEGVLVNVARGSVVDESALIDALGDGTIMGAGLDVFEDEPRVPMALRESDRTVLLPHVGSGTVETRQAMGDLAVDNLVSFFQTGKAKTPVPECRDL